MPPEIDVPARFARFGQALQPLVAKIDRRLAVPAWRSGWISDPVAWLEERMQQLGARIEEIHRHFEAVNREVLGNPAAGAAEIFRAAGRLEAYLDSLLDDWETVRGARAAGEFQEALRLLAGAYRHSIVEIRDWLARFVALLTDPLAEAKRRGLPLTGSITLDLTLKLTTAPETHRLHAWAERQQRKRAGGAWGVLTSLILAWLVVDALDDDDCGGCDPQA